MEYVPFRSVFALLSLLSLVVALIIQCWRYGNIDLTGRWANLRMVYGHSALTGILLAALLRVNIVELFQGSGDAFGVGWMGFFADWTGSLLDRSTALANQLIGVSVTGVVIGFLSKFWNDVFDIVYEFKRFMRGKANAMKPEEGSNRPLPVVREGQLRSRGPRSEGGREGGRDSRDANRSRGRGRGRGGRGSYDRGGDNRQGGATSGSGSIGNTENRPGSDD